MKLSLNNKSRQTKQQLKRSALNSTLSALTVSVVPLALIVEYKHFGYISPWDTEIRSTGTEALTIIYGLSIISVIVWLFSAYNITRCIKMIRHGLYSAEDESPEFVICSNCGIPQHSKDLIVGHCSKCTGRVENLKGYYERHPESEEHQKKHLS